MSDAGVRVSFRASPSQPFEGPLPARVAASLRSLHEEARRHTFMELPVLASGFTFRRFPPCQDFWKAVAMERVPTWLDYLNE
jgi:hypothetical protein